MRTLTPMVAIIAAAVGTFLSSICCAQTTVKAADLDLISAVKHGNVRAARRALENGANVNAVDSATHLEPLAILGDCRRVGRRCAPPKEYPELTELLLDYGADVNSRGFQDATPLMLAVSYNRIRTALSLLDHHADVAARNSFGSTVLHYLKKDTSVSLVKLLIACGADINAADSDQRTPLMYAAIYSSTNVVRLLLQSGVHINDRDFFWRHCFTTASGQLDRYPFWTAGQ